MVLFCSLMYFYTLFLPRSVGWVRIIHFDPNVCFVLRFFGFNLWWYLFVCLLVLTLPLSFVWFVGKSRVALRNRMVTSINFLQCDFSNQTSIIIINIIMVSIKSYSEWFFFKTIYLLHTPCFCLCRYVCFDIQGASVVFFLKPLGPKSSFPPFLFSFFKNPWLIFLVIISWLFFIFLPLGLQ